MRFNFVKPRLTPRLINHFVCAFIVIFTAAALSCLTLFLYKNFYQTITQSKEIIILREKVVIEMIDMDNFNQIIEKLNQKTLPKKITITNNPFD